MAGTVERPRISIAVPSGDMVHASFAMALANLCAASAGFTVQITSARSSIVAIARNNAVAAARRFGAEALLFLDSDMVFPASTLSRLLAHGRDIVGATYVRRVPPFAVLGQAVCEPPVADSEGLIEMARMPTGCLLIRMGVFDRIAAPPFRYETDPTSGTITGEDYVFCDAVRAAGLRVWCDGTLSIEVGHVGQRIFGLTDAAPPGAV